MSGGMNARVIIEGETEKRHVAKGANTVELWEYGIVVLVVCQRIIFQNTPTYIISTCPKLF